MQLNGQRPHASRKGPVFGLNDLMPLGYCLGSGPAALKAGQEVDEDPDFEDFAFFAGLSPSASSSEGLEVPARVDSPLTFARSEEAWRGSWALVGLRSWQGSRKRGSEKRLFSEKRLVDEKKRSGSGGMRSEKRLW